MESAWSSIENGFTKIGLNTPAARFGAVFVITGAAEYFLKPPYAYEGQSMKPFYLLNKDRGTLVPAFVIPVIAGLIAATVF